MKVSVITVCILLLVGCESLRQSATLTQEQAGAMAMRLANKKADALYHCQPFQDHHSARLINGHWVWSDSKAYSRGDIQATVELSDNGCTNNVDIELFDSHQQVQSGSLVP